jgi:hypothetical protein
MANIPDQVIEYFAGRKEFNPALAPYSEIIRPLGLIEIMHNNPEELYAYPITIDTMLGFRESRERKFEKAAALLRDAVALFYGRNPDEVEVTELAVMGTASTLPLRVDYQRRDSGSILQGRLFVKAPDVTRLLAIELYNLLTEKKFTEFMFNKHIIIEKNVDGKPATEIPDCMASPIYQRELAIMDIFNEVIGLVDMTKPGNHLVTDGFRINIVDFDQAFGVESPDCPHPYHNSQDIPDSLLAPGFDREAVHKEARAMLRQRCIDNRERIRYLVRIMKEIGLNKDDAEFIGLKNMGEFVERKLEDILGDKL